MHPKILRHSLLAAVLVFAGCSKQADTTAPVAQKPAAPAPIAAPPPPERIDVVADPARSPHFLAVTKHLQLGGPLFAYVDIDGDMRTLAGNLQGTMQRLSPAQFGPMMQASQHLTEVLGVLGLEDIRAIGMSSVPDGGYFQNRTFFYTPGERHGLMAALGGKAAPFALVKLAPADADIYTETEIDFAAVYKTAKAVVGKVAGEPASSQWEKSLKEAGEAAALSVLDLIYGLKGHAAFVLRVEPRETLRLPLGPQPVTIPQFSFLFVIEGVAAPVEDALKKSPEFKQSQAEALRFYEFAQPLPIKGLTPLIAARGSTLYVGSSKEFITECLNRKSGLADTAKFREAVARVGTEGNGLSYFSPQLFQKLREIPTLNPELPPESLASLRSILDLMPEPDRPLVAVRANLPEGILMRSYWHRSLKSDLATVAVYNPLTVGVLAAMAVPAFQKVRMASQEKAVLNNLRQLAAAADMYYLETGRTSARYDELVGPTRYIKALNSVVGENYRSLRFVEKEELAITLPDGRTIRYLP